MKTKIKPLSENMKVSLTGENVFLGEEVKNSTNRVKKRLKEKSPFSLAKRFHYLYEKISKLENWKTQSVCKVEFDDLPEENKNTMIRVCRIILAENSININKVFQEEIGEIK